MPGRILIVDDDVDVLDSRRMILETEGYTIYTACNADKAKMIITENKVNIVIMDYILPERTGDLIVKDLKTIDDDLSIIFLSGYPQVYRAVEELGFDINRVFLKPVNPEALLLAIRNIYSGQVDLHQLAGVQHVVHEYR